MAATNFLGGQFPRFRDDGGSGSSPILSSGGNRISMENVPLTTGAIGGVPGMGGPGTIGLPGFAPAAGLIAGFNAGGSSKIAYIPN